MPCEKVYSLPSELETACKDGSDLSKISQLYVKTVQADTSKRHDIVHSMAVTAARNAQPEVLKFCFDHGLTLDPENVNPELIYMALDSAIERMKPEADESDPAMKVLKLLIANGWDVNQWLELEGDALTAACAYGAIFSVSFLLSNGADPNSGTACGTRTAPIHVVAGKFPSQEILEMLLHHGLKVHGTGILIAAAEDGNVKAVDRLLKIEGIDLEEVVEYHEYDREPGTALYKAAKEGHEEICQKLIAKGASLEFRDDKGLSVLDIAKDKGLKLDK